MRKDLIYENHYHQAPEIFKKAFKSDFQMKFIFHSPSGFLYEDPPRSPSDELLYGTVLYAPKDSGGAWIRVTTEYGYAGYAERSRLLPYDEEPDGSRWVVASAFADLLPAPEYREVPVMTVFRGSALYARAYDERFMRVYGYDSGVYFVRRESLRPAARPQRRREADGALRDQVVRDALSYYRAPYRWAGKSPLGIDCSGLCFMAHYLNGITVWRDSRPNERYATVRERAQKGDMIHFHNHIALCISDRLFLHAGGRDGRVEYGSLDRRSRYYREDLKPILITSAFK